MLHTETHYGNNVTLHYGVHVLDALRNLPTESVQCIVTSPPYWGLRNYNTEPVEWADGWIGELGQEPTPELFIQHLVLIFRECKRILRKDGTLWLNLGDSYVGGKGQSGQQNSDYQQDRVERGESINQSYHQINPTSGVRPSDNMRELRQSGLKPKDLCMIPAQTALALRADGWHLRAENVWAKPNPMPESVTDRTTRSHEMVYLLTKSRDYFYDHEAVKTERLTYEDRPDGCYRTPEYENLKFNEIKAKVGRTKRSDKQRGHSRRHDGFNHRWDTMSKEAQQENGANLRSVWYIATQPYSGSHYATFPEALPEICIKAGSKEGDTILDPFMGSGTTAAVALRLNRHVIGIDLDPRNLQLAQDRIKKAVARDERTIPLL